MTEELSNSDSVTTAHETRRKPVLTMGPCLFNWKIEDWKEFYFKIAQTDIDEVYLGEVVCHRRDHFFKESLLEVAEELRRCGKKVIFSTISLVLGQPELLRAQEIVQQNPDSLVEVNDISLLFAVAGRPFVVGPTINTYNEDTLAFFENLGAVRTCLPYELAGHTIEKIANKATKDIEVLVFGRTPLAISARCYHARLHKKPKIDCEYVCNKDYNGKTVTTLRNEDFLAINGTQTMSHTYCNLILQLKDLQKMGVNAFRISPHFLEIENMIKTFKDVLEDRLEPESAFTQILRYLPSGERCSNGFYFGEAGHNLKTTTPVE